MTVEQSLRAARSSLQRLLARSEVLDTLADDGSGLGDLLSVACDLQLDLQAARSSPATDDARRLARQLCSELSHASSGYPIAIHRARRTLRELRGVLAPGPR